MKLRIGVLLTVAFMVNVGLSEGRVLSPPLFAIMFGIIWEKLGSANFPDESFVFSFDTFWIIAFADDLVIISTSKVTLTRVVSALQEFLDNFDQVISEVKTEAMTFLVSGRSRSIDVGRNDADNIMLRGVPLRFVDSFKYLGILMTTDLKMGTHVAASEEKARLAALETSNLLRLLEIQEFRKLRMYYLAFVDSQFYGRELFPVQAIRGMKRARSLFLSSMFNLTKSFPSIIVNFVLDLYSVEFSLLKARFYFRKRLMDHDVPMARDALKCVETDLAENRTGWLHESFVLFKEIFPETRARDFDFVRDVGDFLDDFPPCTEMNLEILQKRAESDEKLMFFSFFMSADDAQFFLSMLAKQSVEIVRLILLFISSEIRFRICLHHMPHCPFCPGMEFLFGHFFNCQRIMSLLSPKFISLTVVKYHVVNCEWISLFRLLGDTLLHWAVVLPTFGLDLDLVKQLSELY